MLRALGSRQTLCDGITRRDWLNVGGTSLLGLGLSDLLLADTESQDPTSGVAAHAFGRAKNCIILFLYGSPSQLETFDMKPEAPLEVRGQMDPVASSLAGLDVCEYLPETAKIMDRATVVRSLTHPHPIHGVAFATTGIDQSKLDVAAELNPQDPRHHPYFGSVVEYLDRKRRGGHPGEMVQNVALPFPFSSQRSDQPFRAGPYGAFLGPSNRPVWTEFRGEGTKTVTKARTGFSFTGKEPYLGCTRSSHFEISAAGKLPDMTVDRLDRRRDLLSQFDSTRRDLDKSISGRSFSQFQEMAFSLLSSPKVARALDVRREADSTRDLYGMTLFGQSCLAARRLVEAGTRLVSVFWDEYGLAGDAWDTHTNHHARMKDQLLPPFDLAFSGLIRDLEQRGMLDDTMVVCISEHGRTPKLNGTASRDHWSRAYSAAFAGGGFARGNVVGASDKHASDVAERPVSPKDVLATMYHLLGIDLHTRIPDRTGRPVPLLPESADIVPEMLA